MLLKLLFWSLPLMIQILPADLLKRVKREYPHMVILARALNTADERRLLRVGADRAYRETLETALLMGEDVLELVGMSPLDAQAYAERYRDAAAESQHTTRSGAESGLDSGSGT